MFDVRPLKGNEAKFYDYLNHLDKTYKGKNQSWIKNLLKKWKDYVYWCVTLDDDNIIAFSAMQKHNMPENTVRVLTRTWIDESYRLKKLGKNQLTPNMSMLKNQLNSSKCKHFKKAIITLEPHRSYSSLTYICSRFNDNIGCNFVPNKNKLKTFPSAKPEEYQWYASMDL
tara:strand:+ start:1108 stop:1617 length:510 start_codon:yes stop_codon:yes gene_type:complete